ncbi:MAG: DUF3990 domain-containing protein [Gemmataceae bacterium]
MSDTIVLWHGCVQTAAHDIRINGINLARSRYALDFGPGFYTTTSRSQAEGWARKKFVGLTPRERNATHPAVLRFQLPLDSLAKLEALMFVRGDPRHDAYWSFVHHCRSGSAASPRRHLHPSRAVPKDNYDVVCGPLAAVWPPDGRIAIPDSDQFSFHTDDGIAILNAAIVAGPPDFRIIPL